jgi:hypothetical protein
MILLKWWWVDHDLVVEKANNSPCAVERDVGLELSGLSFSHFFATWHPRIDMNREEDKGLKLVWTSKRWLSWVAGADKSGQLYETATLSLCFREARHGIIMEEGEAGTNYQTGESDNWWYRWETIHGIEHTSSDAVELVKYNILCVVKGRWETDGW